MRKEQVYVFSFFKRHGDGLHLAFSKDGYEWTSLNNDQPLLLPTAGEEKIMRDPCIILGVDEQFHLVWTAGWNEKGIGYSSSKDLLHWSPQQYLPVMAHNAHARNCWAPEIFYYEKEQSYLIYWSSTVAGAFPETQPYGDDGYNHRIYYVKTKDFVSFTETKLLYDPGFNVIDAHITLCDDKYLMFMKNETLTPPQKNIRMAFGNDPYSFGNAGEALTPNHYWAEGPTAMKVGDEWLVYFDKYKINEIGAIRSTNLRDWEEISHLVKFPHGAQHGFVFSSPSAIIDNLIAALAKTKRHMILSDKP